MSNNAQLFWDNHLKEIKKGLINCGRYEGYMQLLRRVLDTFLLAKKQSIDYSPLRRCLKEKIFIRKNGIT